MSSWGSIGFGAFEVDDRREDAVVEAALDLAERARHAQLTLGFALQPVQDPQLCERGPLRKSKLQWTREFDGNVDAGVMSEHRAGGRWRLWIRSDVNGKESAGETALASARQVDVALGGALEERARSAACALGDQRSRVGPLVDEQLGDDVVVAVKNLQHCRFRLYLPAGR